MLGFLFFVMQEDRLMLWSFACCVVLCLFLRESGNKQIRLPAITSSPSIRVSHISLGNAEGDYQMVIDYLMHLDADLLSFQELTPDWNQLLIDRLAPRFSYIHTLTRMDQYGMGFFSRIPFQSLDTIYFRDIPSLSAQFILAGQLPCHVISVQTEPPVNQRAFASIVEHFNFIDGYIKTLDGNTMVMGDFHLPPWSTEVQRFRNTSGLKDGRRDIQPRNLDGSMSLPRIPVEHILFTNGLECTSFAELGNGVVGRLGITGNYQLENEAMAQ